MSFDPVSIERERALNQSIQAAKKRRELEAQLEQERAKNAALEAVFDAIDYYRLKVHSVGYRGRDGYEAFIADPGGHYQEERQRVVCRGEKPMQAIRDGLKALGFDVKNMGQLRSDIRDEKIAIERERDSLRATVAALQQRCSDLTGALVELSNAAEDRLTRPPRQLLDSLDQKARLEAAVETAKPDASSATDGQGGAKP